MGTSPIRGHGGSSSKMPVLLLGGGGGGGAVVIANKRKQRPPVRLACIGASILGMYAIFVSLVLRNFGVSVGGGNGGVIGSGSGSGSGSTVESSPSSFLLRHPPNNDENNGDDGSASAASYHPARRRRPSVVPAVVDAGGGGRKKGGPTTTMVENEPTTTTIVEKEKTAAIDAAIGVDPPKEQREPTVKDFCGLCQWKGMGFNCNERVDWVAKARQLAPADARMAELRHCANYDGCDGGIDDEGFMPCEDLSDNPLYRKPPSTYKIGTFHVERAAELEDILSGASLKRASVNRRNIESSLSRGGGVVGGRSVDRAEGGLRDHRREGEDDIVTSVLTAAMFGDRRYDDAEEGGDDGDDAGRRSREEETEPEAAISFAELTKGDMPVLTAYCEPVNQTSWETKPLPSRDGPSTRRDLFPVSYPNVRSCSALASQWPIDTPPVDLDPFLPWIHDVFPSSDGRDVIFVAQNRRRCHNGQRRVRNGERLPVGVIPHQNDVHIDYAKNYHMRPQSALFQHVPLKRLPRDSPTNDLEEPRYRLASHEEADIDGMETRFICRFKSYDPDASSSSDAEDDGKLSIVGYSLSRFVVDYDYHTYRKGYRFSATEAGYDNHMIWQSQLLFKCPVPPDYRDKVRNGDTVVDDYATLYVDVIPIRTAPRYTPPREFLQPRYEFHNEIDNLFIPDIEWGKEHVLPSIDESGRWENIPVCMPSLMSIGIVPKGADVSAATIPENESDRKYVAVTGELPPKIHKVIACTWASTTFKTRSNRAQVFDGKRRLQEWLEFNLVAGFDHIYVYDNSGAFTNEDSLADIVDLFPRDRVTRVDWPCKICSNRDGNEGERSSQYAAESSCRLRFGTHARWLGSFDTDEYLVPMGKYKSMGEVADRLDEIGVKVAVFKSSPAKPRFDLLE